MLGMLRALVKSVRPKQWVKNGIIFTALLFDQQLLQVTPFLRTLAGFALLCLGAGAVYLMNDLVDLEQDRAHPVKRNRPIASGRLPVPIARGASVAFFIISLAGSFLLEPNFGWVLVTYLGLNLLYSFYLKHIAIIDVLVLASFFILRVAAGVTLITVQRFSPWMYVCVTLLALFMGLGKRRAEMVLLAEKANSHRSVLDGYTISFIDQLLSIVSSTTIVAYALYTFSARNLPENHTMMLTIPFVIYGIFRYLFLIHVKEEGGAPEELLLEDIPLLSTVALWGLSVVFVLYLSQ
jgi:4-hydroxybenzoate polyprenyltransferase